MSYYPDADIYPMADAPVNTGQEFPFKNEICGSGTCAKLPSVTSIWTGPATSCYFRNDGNVTEVSMASIREIAPA